MKIIHVVDSFQPKLGYQEIFLAREQARLGNEVYVVTSDRYSRFVYSGNGKLLGNRIIGAGLFTEEGIKVWRLKTVFEIHSNLIWILGLEDKLRELDPDVIYVHGIANITAPRIARLKKRQANFKLIFDDHGTFDNSRSKLYPIFKWTFSRLIQESADALVAILPETKAFMNKRYGIPLDRISTIPLGADDGLFKFDATARQEMREELALSEDDVVFVYTGKIIPEKQLGILVDAATSLMTEHENIKVVLVGGGSSSYIEQLKQSVKLKRLEDRFAWHEAVPNEQLQKIYSAADVAVWPYSASIGMREAMACGLPIIIGKDSKVTELIDYNNGLTYQEGDISDLARKMEKLLYPALRSEMGRKSRKLIEDRFNWRTIAEQFIELATR